MQRELLTPPKVTPSTLDQGCVWLEEMQHRLNLCMKTGQQVHPRTIITFVQDGSTRHPTSQCTRPVKPRAKQAEWDESVGEWGETEWQDDPCETEEYEAQKGNKGKGKGSKAKGKSKGKTTPKSIAPRP